MLLALDSTGFSRQGNHIHFVLDQALAHLLQGQAQALVVGFKFSRIWPPLSHLVAKDRRFGHGLVELLSAGYGLCQIAFLHSLDALGGLLCEVERGGHIVLPSRPTKRS